MGRSTAREGAVGVAIVAVWFGIYATRALAGHYSLGTNGFDLSVFDYALWSLSHGGRGMVPFMGYSIFSHHFMPILVVLAPIYAAVPSPVFLLLLQLAVVGAAGLVFLRVARHVGLERRLALALLAVFLFSRRTHSALAGFFYPEVFQALLTFVVVLTWTRGSWVYWTTVVLLLMTKEDAAIYLAAFALVMTLTPVRNTRRTIVTTVLAAAWVTVALGVAIPASRSADGLSTRNPLLESRFGSPDGHVNLDVLARRVLSPDTAGRIVNLMATTGGLSVLGPVWLLPGVPGIAINLVADPQSMQAALADHYAWPVLPWLFMAAATGVAWLSTRARRLTLAWVALLTAATLVDNPALQRVVQTRVDPDASLVRAALGTVHGEVVLAQPNLIPHLPHQSLMFATGGGDAVPGVPPDLVLLTEVGNLWPMSLEEVQAEVKRYEEDPVYERVTNGPLHAFARRPTLPTH